MILDGGPVVEFPKAAIASRALRRPPARERSLSMLDGDIDSTSRETIPSYTTIRRTNNIIIGTATLVGTLL